MKMSLLFLFMICCFSMVFSQEINKSVLNEIKKRATETHSDALIIKKGDVILFEDFNGKAEVPIYIASAGKSLASLAIGKLLDLKLLDSLTQPVHTIYPQWKQGSKKDITVKMLLNHTSGIQNYANASIELEPAPDYQVNDIIQLALSAEVSDKPGSTVKYNNKAVALLGGIVQELSGKSFDQFFVDEFFKPMNIVQYEWIRDRSGNPTLHGAFVINPSDLLKFGELMLNKGLYNGKRIISEDWVRKSFEQGQEFTPVFGLLWWRFPEYEHRIIDDEIWNSWVVASVDKSFLKKMRPLKGRLFSSKFEFYDALRDVFGASMKQDLNEHLPANLELSKKIYGNKIAAYYADGFRGNYLVIVPESKVVAVRCADVEGFDYKTDSFSDFVSLVSKLTKEIAE